MITATLTPQELLNTKVVLTMTETAIVLGLTYTKGDKAGKPKSSMARDLVTAGKLRLIDDSQPPWYWRVSANDVRAYLEGRRGPIPVAKPIGTSLTMLPDGAA